MTYRTIVADPPWPMGQVNSGYVTGCEKWRFHGMPYRTMSLQRIAGLPVRDLAAPSSHLYLWTVAAMMRHSFEIVEAWGFRPKQVLVWAKPGLGPGVRFRQGCEYVIFGDRGKRLPVSRRDVSTWFEAPRGSHSQKPEAFQDLVEQISPGPYLEMFARRQRLGWDTWGDEALDHLTLHPGTARVQPYAAKPAGASSSAPE